MPLLKIHFNCPFIYSKQGPGSILNSSERSGTPPDKAVGEETILFVDYEPPRVPEYWKN